MKTTLDLPDDLMREVRIRAVHEHKKLKDAIAEFIRKGMGVGKARPPKIPKPIKLGAGLSRLRRTLKPQLPGAAINRRS